MLTVGHFAFLDHNTYFNVNLTSDELEGESSTISSIQTNSLGFAGFIEDVPTLSILGEDSIIGKYILLQNLEGLQAASCQIIADFGNRGIVVPDDEINDEEGENENNEEEEENQNNELDENEEEVDEGDLSGNESCGSKGSKCSAKSTSSRGSKKGKKKKKGIRR